MVCDCARKLAISTLLFGFAEQRPQHVSRQVRLTGLMDAERHGVAFSKAGRIHLGPFKLAGGVVWRALYLLTD